MDEPAPRQTLSYVKSLLDARGLRPKNKLGQNFLIDLNLLDLIVRTAELDHRDLALEIGTGTGSLTTRLAEHAGAVLSVELDPVIHELARELIGPAERSAHARRRVADKERPQPRACSPHSPRCGRRSTASGSSWSPTCRMPLPPRSSATCCLATCRIERMVVTVQWEIAERLMAKPGTADYGALAVLVQSLADVELVRKLAPAVFWPRPQVESAIVRDHAEHGQAGSRRRDGRDRDGVPNLSP